MESNKDIRWIQRLSSYSKALRDLGKSIECVNDYSFESETGELILNVEFTLANIVQQGVIHIFGNTHELACTIMKDYACYQGKATIGGLRDATLEATRLNIITNENLWMKMINSRNNTLLSYNIEIANEIFVKIINEYYAAFRTFERIMEQKRSIIQHNLMT